jgi:hypothetical protein
VCVVYMPARPDLGLSGEDSRLKQALGDLSPSAVFIVGMPLEYAVRFMALEVAITCRNVYVIEDACWCVVAYFCIAQYESLCLGAFSGLQPVDSHCILVHWWKKETRSSPGAGGCLGVVPRYLATRVLDVMLCVCV